MAIYIPATTYDSVSEDTSGDTGGGTVLRLGDGDTQLYIWDQALEIHAYSMPPLDLDSATYDSSQFFAAPSGGFNSYTGLTPFVWKPDGASLFLWNVADHNVMEYVASTAWDINSVSFDGFRNLFSEFDDEWSLRFRPDGTMMFVGEPDGARSVRMNALSPAWDISSASMAGAPSFDIGAEIPGGDPLDFWISGDGKTLLVLNIVGLNGVVHQLEFGTPWDIQTLEYNSVSYTLPGFTSPTHLSFDIADDESKMMVLAVGGAYEEVHVYSLADLVLVEAAHEAVIPLRTGAAHEAVIPLRTGAAHEAVIPLRLGVAHEAVIPWRVEAAHEAVIPMLHAVEAVHQAVWDLQGFHPVEAVHEAVIPLQVEAVHQAVIPLHTLVEAVHEAVVPLRITVETAHESVIPLLDHNQVEAVHQAVWSLLGAPRTHLSLDVTLTAGGTPVPVVDWTLSTDEGGYLYEGEITVGAGGYGLLAVDQPVALDLFGEAYQLVVESKRRDRNGPAGRRFVIGVRSPTVEFDFPRAEPVTRTFEETVRARDAVEDLLGEAVSWELVDWPIPAFRLAWEAASPIAAARQIVEAAGGTLQTDTDGTLRVRHLYPDSPKDLYAGATPARMVDDQSDVARSSESFEPRRLVDRLVIRDTAESLFQDRLEFERDEDGGRAGTVHVYPSPWRTNLVVVHTSNASLQLTQTGEVTREEEEIVEFAAGTASLRFPIDALLEVEWLYVSLGAITFEPYATELQAGGEDAYSLARIRYRVRSIDYRLASPTVDQAQLLLKEIAA